DKVFPIFVGSSSIHLTKHACEMLLCPESARHRHIHDARFLRAENLLRAFHPAAQNELVWGLTGRLAKHHGEMRSTQSYGLRQIDERQVAFQSCLDELRHVPQARSAQTTTVRRRGPVPRGIAMHECHGERLLDGIEKQPPTWKSRDPFGIQGRG